MLDNKLLEVISRFKLALLTRSAREPSDSALLTANRGKKLAGLNSTSNTLKPKIVEYDGTNHLVLTNDVIERTNYRNKRRWLDFYKTDDKRARTSSGYANRASDISSDVSGEEDGAESESESGSDNEDDDPLRKLRLSELLAPLAHPSEIVTHPAISKTYKLTSLSVMASEIIDMIEVEQNTLNQLNKLFRILDGEDWYYQLEDNMELVQYDHGLDDLLVKPPAADSEQAVASKDALESTPNDITEVAKKEDVGTDTAGEAAEAGGPDGEPATNGDVFENKRITRTSAMAPGQIQITDPFFALPKSLEIYERQQQIQVEEQGDDGDELNAIQMELMNYLQVSIQRQHEYIKNLSTIRGGLVRADRYKKELLRWGKEMSEKK